MKKQRKKRLGVGLKSFLIFVVDVQQINQLGEPNIWSTYSTAACESSSSNICCTAAIFKQTFILALNIYIISASVGNLSLCF